MNDYLKEALLMVQAATPASGFRPETPEEWRNAQRASEELGYAMFRQGGLDEKSARKLANEISGGLAGFLLLDIAFREGRDE